MENPDPSDLLVLVTVCSVSLVYFLVLLFARRADKMDVVKVFNSKENCLTEVSY